MKSILIVSLWILSFGIVFAQDNMTEQPENKGHYVGIIGGLSLGYGITYRYWPEELGIELTLTPHITDYGKGLLAGSSLFYTLNEGNRTRLFLYTGGFIAYSYEEYFDNVNGETYIYYGLGAGPGIEIQILDNFVLDLMAGYGYSTIVEGLTFVGEIGLFYRF